MDELADSAPLLNDQEGLRRRLAVDGYLFFRGLLPAAQVRAAGRAVLARLRSGGWVDDRGIPSLQPRAVNSMDALADPAFRAAMFGPAFNQVPYLPALREVVRRVLGPSGSGPGAFSYPAKVLRAVYPERPEARPRGRYIHYDYGVSGVQDMAGRPPATSRATRSSSTALTPHAALPNRGSALRLSGDFRWQRPDQPTPAELVLGPAARPPVLFCRLFRRERWWEPVPAGLTLHPRARMIAVPPGTTLTADRRPPRLEALAATARGALRSDRK
ncbi:MAG: hypothetical protein ACRDOE_13435 [Streptosporangiaceae bacterium]